MVSILDSAKYLVYLSYKKNNYSLTPLKLQKILYFAQGWSYVWDGKRAFPQEFEAWQYGPVNKEVYDYFKKYGRLEIPADEGSAILEDKDVKETLNAVWEEYGKMNAFELVRITHSQEPWKQTEYYGERISNDSIKKYFQATYC